jgi:predicted nucleotidyltransferase
MTSELLDISHKLDAGTVAIYRDVADAAASLGIDYLVIGASGRDLIMSVAYGLQVQRATNDYDFAFEVGNLSEFENLRAALQAKGFTQSRQSQRLASPQGVHVDLLPFGDFADKHGDITLPPGHDHQMSVLGFPEALANAQMVRMSHQPLLDVPVVSLPGLTLLKLIAWGDRPRGLRAKDAQDFRYLINGYSTMPADVSGIWNELAYLDTFDGDIELVAAALLGRQTRSIAGRAAFETVKSLLTGEQLTAFVVDMEAKFARVRPSHSFQLIEAFRHGFITT